MYLTYEWEEDIGRILPMSMPSAHCENDKYECWSLSYLRQRRKKQYDQAGHCSFDASTKSLCQDADISACLTCLLLIEVQAPLGDSSNLSRSRLTSKAPLSEEASRSLIWTTVYSGRQNASGVC